MQDGMRNAEEHKDRIQVYHIETSVNANTFIFYANVMQCRILCHIVYLALYR